MKTRHRIVTHMTRRKARRLFGHVGTVNDRWMLGHAPGTILVVGVSWHFRKRKSPCKISYVVCETGHEPKTFPSNLLQYPIYPRRNLKPLFFMGNRG